MNALGFKADRKIIDVIRDERFTLSAEIIPPRNGTEQRKVLEQVSALIKSGAEFLSVTKGAGGSLRGGSLPIAQAIKETLGVPCIAHFTCRDLTPQEVENQLIDHHYFGIRNILALRGDPPQDQQDWQPREGSYPYAYQLIEQIQKLNRGEFLKRSENRAATNEEKTDFCVGAAVYPEHPVEDERIRFFDLKVKAGAEYAITQMLFDDEAYARFLNDCEKAGIHTPILPGTRLLKSQKQALTMAKRFQVSVPKLLLNALPTEDTPASRAQSLDVFWKYLERLKSRGAPGLHLFVLSDTEMCCEFLKPLKSNS